MPQVQQHSLSEDFLALSIALTVALALMQRPEPACAQQPDIHLAPIEIVLDVSSLMRARIGEVERMTVARELVRALRAELASGGAPPAIGLRVYGADSPRARRDCRDTRLAVSATDRHGDLPAALASLHPQGWAPLAFTLERALADTARTYVLVTSGGGDCGGDACGVWRQFVSQGTNREARLHVVALAPAPEDIERLRCLSRAGSGTFIVVSDPAAVGAAATRLALILKNQGLLDVRLSLGEAEPLVAPVRLLVPRTREVVAAFSARGPRPVPAGIYTVVIETSPAIQVERVMVLPGERATIERSDFGRLSVELRDEENRPVRAPVTVRAGRRGTEIRFAYTGEPIVLQEGIYDVAVDLGDSLAVRRGIQVAAGGGSRIVLGGAGTVRVVSPEFPEPPATRAILSHGARADTVRVGESLLLPAGRYRLRVETIPVYVSDDVTVGAGETTVVELPPMGLLRVVLVGLDRPVAGVPVRVQEPLTEEPYGVLASGERRLVMPGSFRLELGTVPTQRIDEVVVVPGQETLVERRGLSRILVVPPVPGGTYRLEVLSAPRGRRLGEAVGAPPSIVAWPGTYHVRVHADGRLVWEGAIAVAPDRAARIDWPRP